MKPKQQTLNSLKKRVMQISGDPFPLRQSLVHASAHLFRHLLDPEKISRIDQPRDAQKADRFEPQSLSERRWDRKCKVCSGFIPDSVVVGGQHTKAIRPRWQVGVEDLTPRTR